MLRTSPKRQRGLGLVELMVGITVGLIVAAGASMVAVNQINEHRRLMLETQIQQDLRTAADILQQDLRRAGYRGDTGSSVWAPAAAVGSLKEKAAQLPTPNPYTGLTLVDDAQTRSLSYRYARGATTEYGFKWDKRTKALYLKLGVKDGQPNWQPITDPESVVIRDFQIDVDDTQSVNLGDFCDKPCDPTGAAAPACPTQVIRRVSFTIVGQAAHDSNVKRTLSSVERIRADDMVGSCP